MDTDTAERGLALHVIWVDDDMIELACSIAYGGFRGESTCYTTSARLNDFADSLSRFSLTAEGQAAFESGLSDNTNACNLLAYTIDKASHMAVHVRMATDQLTTRPRCVARLELEMLVEAWSLSQFADQLRQMAKSKSGEAFLAGCRAEM